MLVAGLCQDLAWAAVFRLNFNLRKEQQEVLRLAGQRLEI